MIACCKTFLWRRCSNRRHFVGIYEIVSSARGKLQSSPHDYCNYKRWKCPKLIEATISIRMSDPRNYFIQPLDPSKHRREEFDCGVDALNDYWKKRARKEIDAGLAVCFVAVPESDPGRIAGFYTLSAATILTTALPEAVTRKLPRYGEIPATLLGRLARSTAFKGQGLGDRLMMSAFARAAHGAEEVASWAFVTDPKDDNARRFYEEFGFSVLGTNRLFMTIKQVKTLLSTNAP